MCTWHSYREEPMAIAAADEIEYGEVFTRRWVVGALLTAEAGRPDYVEPSASLSLANIEAAIGARIEYIKLLPDDVFDELTK